MSFLDKKQKIELMLKKGGDPKTVLELVREELRTAPDTEYVRELQAALQLFEESFPDKREFYETLTAADKRFMELMRTEYESGRKKAEKRAEFSEELA